MKITDVKLRKAKHYLFVQIETDAGITGLGEAGNWGYLDATAAAILKYRDYLIGKDPFMSEHHYQNMYRCMYFRGSVIMSAISAIDIALWDIKGKALGVPVYQLLGGKTREKVRVYASSMKPFDTTAESLAADCVKLKKQGFTAAKLFVCDSDVDQSNDFYSNKIVRLAGKVKTSREAVGDNFDLIIEVHRGLNTAEAVAFAREIEKYHPMVLEDPITPDDPAAMGELAGKINIPIATGERFINYQEFKTLFDAKGATYVRPDVCAVGGITAAKKVAVLAEANSAMVIPHNPLGPVSTAACLQICASIPNLGIQELPGFCLNGQEDAMVKVPLRCEDGFLMLPETPGIGVELADDAEIQYPVNERGGTEGHFHFDGSVRDF